MHKLLASALLLALASAPSQAAAPALVTVDLGNFRFAPKTLHLQAGAPVTLRLRNLSRGGHSFSSPGLFSASRVDPRSVALIRNGQVEVPGGASVDVSFTPAAGNYRLTCTHAFHSMLGMKGQVIVH